MSAPAPATAIVLRAAAVWGTTVLDVRNLLPGQSYLVCDAPGAALPKPDGTLISDAPIRAVGTGFELDARGATGGVVYLRGRREDPVQLAQSGAPIPIVAGDYGLLQYRGFSVFFQFAHVAPQMVGKNAFDWGILLAFVFSSVLMIGLLLFAMAMNTPYALPSPNELLSEQALNEMFKTRSQIEEQPPQPTKKDDGAGTGVKDPGAKDKKEQGGGKKMAREEGALGKNGDAADTKLTGEVRNGLGGMTEALNSEVGDEVRKTLGSISSVADALGGLRSDSIQFGRGGGTGLKGGGPGGGGDGAGVPFGSGTLDTGWGAGNGGGFGSGSGGPGGAGAGGPGKGGRGGDSGAGSGAGPGEHKVTGKDAPAAGQGLSPGQISRVVTSRYGAFRACYESAASSDPSLSGSVGVSFSISPGGSVASVSMGGSSLGPRVSGCVKRQFERLSFPAADKATNASWSFVFKPSKK